LKTAVRVYLDEHPDARKEDVAASFQAAAVDTLVGKTLQAVETHAPASVIVAGGVSANESLGSALRVELGDLPLHVSERRFSGDNAAMIAAAGYFRAREGKTDNPLSAEADPNMRLA
jgi:N6-L-threonylcarbamoyladenine synthase